MHEETALDAWDRQQSSPITMLPRFGKGCCNTTIWKNGDEAMTKTMGARSRKAPAIRRTSTATALIMPPPS